MECFAHFDHQFAPSRIKKREGMGGVIAAASMMIMLDFDCCLSFLSLCQFSLMERRLLKKETATRNSDLSFLSSLCLSSLFFSCFTSHPYPCNGNNPQDERPATRREKEEDDRLIRIEEGLLQNLISFFSGTAVSD
jgi:hypothetical protein